MTKRNAEDLSPETNISSKKTKLEIYTTDKTIAFQCQMFTQINTQDGEVYTTWNILHGYEYFDGLLDTDLINQSTRIIDFSPLNMIETCVYLDILVSSSSTTILSPESWINLYYQFDRYLMKDKLPIIKKELLKCGYSNELYNFNVEQKIISTPELAKMYIVHILQFGEVDKSPPRDDDFLWGEIFSQINIYHMDIMWRIIQSAHESVLIKHLAKCHPRYDLHALNRCLNLYSHDPRIIQFIKHTVDVWVK